MFDKGKTLLIVKDNLYSAINGNLREREREREKRKAARFHSVEKN